MLVLKNLLVVVLGLLQVFESVFDILFLVALLLFLRNLFACLHYEFINQACFSPLQRIGFANGRLGEKIRALSFFPFHMGADWALAILFEL